MRDFIITQFSWHRLSLFIKSDLMINLPKILTLSVTIFVVLFLYGLASFTDYQANNFHADLFALVIFAGGLWLTSYSFADLHNNKRASTFLLLPASNLEKLLGRLLLTSVGYIIAIVLVFYLVSLMIASFAWLIFDKVSIVFLPFHKDLVHCYVSYIVFHSLFFLGAIHFKTSNFSKTILSLCGIVFFFIIMAYSFFWIFLENHYSEGWLMLEHYGAMLKFIFVIIVLPGAWLATYYCLCESET